MKLQPLEFEKPIVELEEKLADLKKHSRANDINFDTEVRRMEGKIEETKQWGRDHHPYAFSLWMTGAGVKPGLSYGASDEFGFNAVENKVHVHDLQATILHLLGIDHERLTYKFQGRNYRLTDVHGHVVKGVLA